VRFRSINPPGDESEIGGFLAKLLEDEGFGVRVFPMGRNRSNVIADLPVAGPSGRPLVLTGHLDTVPLGSAEWLHDPFAGETDGDKLYGRGSSDMKAGLAALICAAVNFARFGQGCKRGVRLVLTAGEETGCEGAQHLRDVAALGEASAVIVAEPTSNYPALGHKGALFARCVTMGVTAHSSMPQQGVNAIYKAARAISRLEQFPFDANSDQLLGRPTLNVGMISGGLNVNSVPDRAEFSVDVRSVSGMHHSAVLQDLQRAAGEEISIEPFVDLAPVKSETDDAFVESVFKIMEMILRETIKPHALPYFTDACVLQPVYDCPVVILGPGAPEMAHKTDEFCLVSKMEESIEAYSRILDVWCR
jgi:succinyl-diaminopimelate desuccinylase